jgi:hypothetical protein
LDAVFMSHQLNACLAYVDHEDQPAPERCRDASRTLPDASRTLPDASRTLPDAAGRLPDALKPGIHGVRTPWIRGFMAFQLARYTGSVLLTVPE